MYVATFGDDDIRAIDTNIIQETFDIMRTSTDASSGLLKLNEKQKKVWKLFEDFWLGYRCFMNLSWTVEFETGDGPIELEVSVNINSISTVNVSIYNDYDSIPIMETFNIHDTCDIVSFIQKHTYHLFFEDARHQYIMLRDSERDALLVNLQNYSNIRSSLKQIMMPLNSLLQNMTKDTNILNKSAV